MPASNDTIQPTYLEPEHPTQLHDVFSGTDEIAVDTEFMREDTYFAEFCLLQAAVGPTVYLLDPLATTDLRDTWEVLLARNWVLHSGRQDLEVVFQVAGTLPSGIFDTQVAAALLGYAPQLGYANLVRELFDVELSKTQTRADWRRRPLSKAMLSYAAADVQYLLDAANVLRERLAELGRLEWALEDSGALLEVALYAPNAEDAFERLKGAGRLTGHPRAVARQLAAWREKRALRSNRPRQWIMKNTVLIEIARRCPQSAEELGQIDALPAGVLRRSGEEILSLVQAARDAIDDYRPPSPPNEREKAALKQLQLSVAQAAEALGISADILAPRRDLVAALRGDRSGRLFSGWRFSVIGNALERVL